MTDTTEQAGLAERRGFRMPLGRRGWLLLALALVAAGVALNWGWLTAVGAAPLILAVAPCAAMCAFGLCSTGGRGQCANKGDAPAAIAGPETGRG